MKYFVDAECQEYDDYEFRTCLVETDNIQRFIDNNMTENWFHENVNAAIKRGTVSFRNNVGRWEMTIKKCTSVEWETLKRFIDVFVEEETK